MKVGDEDPEEEWTDIEGVVSARAVGRRSWGGCWRCSMPREKEEEREGGGCSRPRVESVRSKMGSSRGWAAVVVGV